MGSAVGECNNWHLPSCTQTSGHSVLPWAPSCPHWPQGPVCHLPETGHELDPRSTISTWPGCSMGMQVGGRELGRLWGTWWVVPESLFGSCCPPPGQGDPDSAGLAGLCPHSDGQPVGWTAEAPGHRSGAGEQPSSHVLRRAHQVMRAVPQNPVSPLPPTPASFSSQKWSTHFPLLF